MRDLTLSTYVSDAGPTVVTLDGSLTAQTGRALRDELLATCSGYRTHVVLDVTALRFCDADGLNTILAAHQHATRAGGSLTLVGPPHGVARVLRVTELDQYFTIFRTVVAATASAAAAATAAGEGQHASTPPAAVR